MTQTKRKKSERRGRCYKLAVHELMENQKLCTNPTTRLVHGTIEKYLHHPIPHAWIEYDSTDELVWHPEYGWVTDKECVWEPIRDSHMSAYYFYPIYKAKKHHSYTLKRMLKWLTKTGNYGPWEGDYWKLEGAKRKQNVVAA